MNRLFRNIDSTLLYSYLFITIFGVFTVSSVSQDAGNRQLIWLLISLFFCVLIFFVRVFFIETFAYALYGLGIVLLLGLFPFGVEKNGAKAWYVFGGFSMQPVEFVKLFVSLALAKLISSLGFDLKQRKYFIRSILLIGFPTVLVLAQPDLGSVLIFIAFFITLFVYGFSGWYFVIGLYFIILFLLALNFHPVLLSILFMVVLAAAYYFLNKKYNLGRRPIVLFAGIWLASVAVFFTAPVVLKKLPKHQRERIMVLFEGEMKYRDTAGYNLLYSKTAIGSGGFLGKGYRGGTVTAGHFVPEQHTDYIFSAVGEEWGFVGSFVLILAYSILILRMYQLSEKIRSKFAQAYGYSVASIFALHLVINLSMVLGLFPTVGIPLPLFSYGGSSLLAFSLMVGLFMKFNFEDNRSLF